MTGNSMVSGNMADGNNLNPIAVAANIDGGGGGPINIGVIVGKNGVITNNNNITATGVGNDGSNNVDPRASFNNMGFSMQ